MPMHLLYVVVKPDQISKMLFSFFRERLPGVLGPSQPSQLQKNCQEPLLFFAQSQGPVPPKRHGRRARGGDIYETESPVQQTGRRGPEAKARGRQRAREEEDARA